MNCSSNCSMMSKCPTPVIDGKRNVKLLPVERMREAKWLKKKGEQQDKKSETAL